jgi:hypothetical protein
MKLSRTWNEEHPGSIVIEDTPLAAKAEPSSIVTDAGTMTECKDEH